jgi:hypothetical protein
MKKKGGRERGFSIPSPSPPPPPCMYGSEEGRILQILEKIDPHRLREYQRVTVLCAFFHLGSTPLLSRKRCEGEPDSAHPRRVDGAGGK